MHHFVHIEFSVTDLVEAKRFYRGLFNWNIVEAEGIEDYLFFTVDEEGEWLGGG